MKRFIITPVLFLFCISFYAGADETIQTFSSVHQHGGTRTVQDTFGFPESFDGFSAVEMTYTLECPDGGCDPWDRFACVKILKHGREYEIGRYMTPYGMGWNWTMDVTDFSSLLCQEVVLSSFIDTWVNPG